MDAEGRYYHKGLYLHTSKFEGLDKSAITSGGPNIWGCNVYDKFISSYRRNGLTCSGFVTWAMLNGGFETGDVGAGDTSYLTDELSDLGPHNILTYDFMKNGDYQVGDFIADDGHAALIIGIDDNYIYTAESLLPKLMVYKYGRYKEINNINIQMIKFSLLGETILEWNDKVTCAAVARPRARTVCIRQNINTLVYIVR